MSFRRVCPKTMFQRAFAIPLLTLALLACPCPLLAQHGGGRSQPGANSRPVICVHDCRDPNASDNPEEDRQLQHLMAVQATSDQSTAFNLLLQEVQAASTRLQAFVQLLQTTPAAAPSLSDSATGVEQAIDKARSGSQNFLASFSAAQKTGLKDATKRVESADSDLDKERMAFDQTQQAREATRPVGTSATNLENALANLQTQQLALAREMSIVLPADGQDIRLPAVKNTIELGGQSISIAASGVASRASSPDGSNQFTLRIVADLSALQQNITGILRSRLTSSPRCGERIEIQHAGLTPQDPTSVVAVHVHYERWICPGGSPIELANSDGNVEVKLTPSIEPNSGLHLISEFGRVDAEGLFRDSLLTGALGDTLREQIGAALFPAMETAADLKAILPPAARNSAVIRKVQFQNAGAGQLNLVIDGGLQLSEEQSKQFGAQTQPPGSTPEAAPTPAASADSKPLAN